MSGREQSLCGEGNGDVVEGSKLEARSRGADQGVGEGGGEEGRIGGSQIGVKKEEEEE